MKNYSKVELQKATKNMTVIIALMLAIIIAVSVVLGVGFGVYGTDASKWFKPADGGEEQPAPDVVVTPDPEPSSLMTLLLGAVTTAEDGTKTQSVTASMPSNVAPNNKAVTWALSFANPSSTWANGKTVTDYVSVEPTSDGALTATLTFKQAFGEQIILTCQSVVVPELKATATIDSIKHIESYALEVNGDDAVTTSFNIKLSADDVNNQNTVEFANIEWSVGTVTPNISIDSVELFACFDYGSWDVLTVEAEYAGIVDEDTYDILKGNTPLTFEVTDDRFSISARSLINTEYVEADKVEDLYNLIYRVCGNEMLISFDPTSGSYIKVNYSVTFGGKTYNDSATVDVADYSVFSLPNFNVMPSSLRLDSTTIYFY